MANPITITGSTIQGTVAIGDSASATNNGTQRLAGAAAVNSFDELFSQLARHGVVQADAEALRTAITADKNAPELANKQFGPRVKGWIDTMIRKAAAASWQVELGIAGSLLATAIQRFYGWP